MKLVIVIFAALMATGCVTPRSISSIEMGIQDQLVFKSDKSQTVSAANEVVSDLGWSSLYAGDKRPDGTNSSGDRSLRGLMMPNDSGLSNTSNNIFSSAEDAEKYDQMAFAKAEQAGAEPEYYLQAKTPKTPFTYGAEIFVVFYDKGAAGSVVSIAASSSQLAEKDKLEGYISEFTSRMKKKLK